MRGELDFRASFKERLALLQDCRKTYWRRSAPRCV